MLLLRFEFFINLYQSLVFHVRPNITQTEFEDSSLKTLCNLRGIVHQFSKYDQPDLEDIKSEMKSDL